MFISLERLILLSINKYKALEIITSLQNPKIKNLLKLQKPQERKSQGIFIVEGLKEVQMAIQAGYLPDTLYFFAMPHVQVKNIFSHFKVYEISQNVFEKLAYREGSDGVLATFKSKNLTLDDVQLSSNPLVLVLESVEKPGNLGAILRTADAAKVDAVLVCDARTDIFNPNVVRSSVGCLFTNQIVTCSNEQAFHWLKKHEILVYSAALAADAKAYHEIDYTKASAIVMGTEAVGLSDFWMSQCDQKIIIPMLGKNDSLNVSVSAAIIVFEAKRQRNFK